MTNQVGGKKENQHGAMKIKNTRQAPKLLQTSGSTLCNHLDLTMDGIYRVFDLYCHPLDTWTKVSEPIHNINAITTQVPEWYWFGYSLFKEEWKMFPFTANSVKLFNVLWVSFSSCRGIRGGGCQDFSTILECSKTCSKNYDTTKNIFTSGRKI